MCNSVLQKTFNQAHNFLCTLMRCEIGVPAAISVDMIAVT